MQISERDLALLRFYFSIDKDEELSEIREEHFESAVGQGFFRFLRKVGRGRALKILEAENKDLAFLISQPTGRKPELQTFELQPEVEKVELSFLSRFVEKVKGSRPLTLREAQLNAQTQLERLQGLTLNMGFPELEDKLGTLFAGRYLILGARPSVGKTSLLLQMAVSLAKQVPVLFYSLEMLNYQIIGRLIAQKVGCGFKEAIKKISDFYFEEILRKHLWLVDSVSLDFSVFKSQLLEDIEATEARVVMIDYLQLFSLKEASMDMVYKTISAELKKIAKDKRIVLFVASQLNRKAEDRGKAILADLRYSGSLEQDCDVALLLHRKVGEETAVLEIAKNRDGETGLIELVFEGRKFSFRERTREERIAEQRSAEIEKALLEVAEELGNDF